MLLLLIIIVQLSIVHATANFSRLLRCTKRRLLLTCEHTEFVGDSGDGCLPLDPAAFAAAAAALFGALFTM